jgi:site-specific recombinase XerD
MAKKELQAGKCYYISTDREENPKLGAKLLSDGRESLFLDFYFGYEMVYSSAKDKMEPKKQKRRESLKLYLWHSPRTPQQRQENKETLLLAKKIRHDKGQELLDQEMGYRLQTKKSNINFLDYFQEYLDEYTKKDVRMIQIALQRFKDFLRDTPEYSRYERKIKPEQITSEMVEAFTEYLQTRSVGEGAKSIYQRFKKVYKSCAIKCNINYQRPFVDSEGKTISITVDEGALVKDFLSPDEERLLMETHYQGENPEIRNAFVFCLYTGMRFCDVKDLRYSNIDYANKLLRFEQDKTKGHSARSWVTIPLNEGLIHLVGRPKEGETKESLVFNLPSYESCCKSVKRWVKRAGIDKHISWHCARHSFAVNILNNGANIKTVASLLGHSGLKHTEKYTRAVDKLKEDAINSLPALNL